MNTEQYPPDVTIEVTLQSNGLMRNSAGHLIGSLYDEVEYDSEHIIEAKSHFDELKTNIQKDSDYAWSWHCNIAVCSQDEGMEHAASNRAAARFMKMCFDVENYEPVTS